MEKKAIEIEETMNREQVATFFRMLANGLQSGTLDLKNDKESLTLSPSDMISVEIGAKQKKDKSKFSLEMSWRCPEMMKGSVEPPQGVPSQGESTP